MIEFNFIQHLFTILVFSLATTFLFIEIAFKVKFTDYFLDIPNARSAHTSSTPRVGGICIYINLLLLTFYFFGFDNEKINILLVSISLIFFISVLDDIFRVFPLLRLGVHCFTAIYFLYFYFMNISLAYLVIFVIIVVSSINIFNFIDGSDGFVSGIIAVAMTFFIAHSINVNNYEVFIISAIICFSSFAFLLFNFFPAKVFLGDSGSTLLGLGYSALSIIGFEYSLWPSWFPLLLVYPFVLDASITLLIRIVRREKFWEAHRNHYYQKIILIGFPSYWLAIGAYLTVFFCGILGSFLMQHNNINFVILSFGSLSVIFLISFLVLDIKISKNRNL